MYVFFSRSRLPGAGLYVIAITTGREPPVQVMHEADAIIYRPPGENFKFCKNRWDAASCGNLEITMEHALCTLRTHLLELIKGTVQ